MNYTSKKYFIMSDSRNATSSWSGYLHQGKVGVFVALKKIVDLINGKKSEQEIKEVLEKWRLIYENAEDFDIQESNDSGLYIDKVDSSKWIVDSRHQVKAYKDGNNLKDYESVLETTKYGTDGSWVCGFEISNCSNDKKYLHTINEVKGFGLSSKEYKKQQSEGKIHSSAKYLPNPNNIILYPYPDGSYCDITSSNDKIKEWCNEEIKKIKGNGTIDNIYEKLLYLLDEEIRNKHSGGGFPIFSFYNIYNCIINFTTFEEEYDEMRLRESFVKYYEYYKLDKPLPYNDINMDILEEYMNVIYSMNKENFYSYLKEIHFDEDFFGEGVNFNKRGFGSVICDFIYNIKGISKLEEFNNFIQVNNYKTSCCTEEENRKVGTIRGLIENINNGRLSVNLFSGKKIMNRHINLDIEPFTTIKDKVLENSDRQMSTSNESKISELTGSSLITTKTILDNINK